MVRAARRTGQCGTRWVRNEVAPRPYPPAEVGAIDGLGSSPGPTAKVVALVASLIPTPGEALGADDHAWEAFFRLLDEAADLLVDVLGHSAAPALRRLAAASADGDPVHALLVERALDRMARDHG